ncbi:putative indole-3-pyruvate monooxygenase YUCCA8 [Bidens hawaiensis]|uniref:putative indole-3-pyruvate monooxygenase YUCCA8 n=1 Tax=Bidens hawaiensis TaxID=980011 RepID=UPI00404B0F43
MPPPTLEREDCIASSYNKKTYDRLHLHVAKHFCQLPSMPFPSTFPKYVARADFVEYLDHYVSHFNIHPEFRTTVQFAKYDEHTSKWEVKAAVGDGGGVRCYVGWFLVVATGENTDPVTPEVDGLSEFKGEVIHSTEYKSGTGYENKKVLVVGAGNSGMEIALDLSNHCAKTSIVVRSPVHIVSRWSLNSLFLLLDLLPLHLVDSLTMLISKVLPALKGIKGGNEVVFEDGKCHQFDAIVFATGFKRSTHLWLQGQSLTTY